MKRTIIIRIVVISVLMSGCKTYYIPIESFQNQFSNIDPTQLKMVRMRGPVGDIAEYYSNSIDKIKCQDKKGNEYLLPNSPSIEARITTLNGKRTKFYFDRIYLQNDTLVGYRSRFIGLPKSIPMSDVTKIEIQDGGKNFQYVDKK